MEQQLRSDVLRLTSQLERVRQEHRDKRRALLAETRARQDAIQDWYDDQQALIEGKKAHLLLQIALASQPPTSSGPTRHELEPVTSSSPVDTVHAAGQLAQQLIPPQPALLALSDRPQDAPSSSHTSHSQPSADPAEMQDHSVHPLHEPELDAHVQMPSPASSPVAGLANAQEATAEPNQPAEDAESEVEIDIAHVIPVAGQKCPGVSTYMICRPRHRRGMYEQAIKCPLKSEPKCWHPHLLCFELQICAHCIEVHVGNDKSLECHGKRAEASSCQP